MKMTSNERRPSMEDDLPWKTTFHGRRTSMEDDLPWKKISKMKNRNISATTGLIFSQFET
jgi:hypothetical protein